MNDQGFIQILCTIYKLKKELLKWERWGIIEKANSQHNNTLHRVTKSDGTVRAVLDLRCLNRFVMSSNSS